MSLWSKLTLNKEDEAARREVARQAKRIGQPFCPRCYSTAITAHKKGFLSSKVELHCSMCRFKFHAGHMMLSHP